MFSASLPPLVSANQTVKPLVFVVFGVCSPSVTRTQKQQQQQQQQQRQQTTQSSNGEVK
jgi:hypothetical protein